MDNTATNSSLQHSRTGRIFLTRGLIAIAWAAVVAGLAFVAAAGGDEPMLSMLAIYAATGGVDFLIEAWLLARRRRDLAAPAGPVLSAS